MSGLYWSLTFLDLSNSIDKLNKDEIVQFLKRNQHENGGFGPCGRLIVGFETNCTKIP